MKYGTSLARTALAGLLALALPMCKPAGSSDIKDLGGNASQYNCKELRESFVKDRDRLKDSLAKFIAEHKKLGLDKKEGDPQANAGSGTDTGTGTQVASLETNTETNTGTGTQVASLETNPNTDLENPGTEEGLTLQGEDDPQKHNILLGVGEYVAPEFPESLQNEGRPFGETAFCDVRYGKYKLDTATPLHSLCKLSVELNKSLSDYVTYHNKRDDCRDSKAAQQTGVVSTEYGYCRTKCSFAEGSTCAKCDYKYGILNSSYICAGADDAIIAINEFCKAGGHSCTVPKAEECKIDTGARFGKPEQGSAENKWDQDFAQVDIKVFARVEAEFNEVASVSVNAETAFNASIKYGIVYKDFQGEQAFVEDGKGVWRGNTNLNVNCNAEVTGMGVVTVGGTVGAGFDIVVASGKAVAGVQETLTLVKSKARPGREFSGSGRTKLDLIASCLPHAKNFVASELPQIIKEESKLRAVAKLFMREERAAQERDVSGNSIYCNTTIGGVTGGKKVYRINKVKIGLTKTSIDVVVNWTGRYLPGSSDTSTAGLTKDHLGNDYYVALRDRVFKGVADNVTDDDIRKIGHWTWDKFTDCDRTSW